MAVPKTGKRKTKIPSRRPPQPVPRSGSVVLIDGAPIRSKARKAYEKVVRDLENARREAGHFRQHDQPAFQHWLHANFGALLTAIRESSQKLSELRGFMDEIQMEAFWGNTSIEEAYRLVRERRENPQPRAEEPDPDDPFDHFERFMDDLFGEDDEQCEEKETSRQEEFWNSHFRDHAPPPSPLRSHRENPAASRIKDLYRALVRRLHPDASNNPNPQRIEWWHMTQTAYLKGDVDQLEVILTLCQMDEKGPLELTSVSLLFRITAHFKSALRSLRRELKQMRLDPAWEFSRCQDLESRTAITRHELEGTLAGMRRQIADAEALLAEWKRPPKARRKRRRNAPDFSPDYF